MDHDHELVYEHIKHVQPSYFRNATCGNGGSCSHAFILQGFNNEVQIKMPVDVSTDTSNAVVGNIPKSDWNIYIPHLKVTAKDLARIASDSSAHLEVRPLYGLPVLATTESPQFPDGIPLSYLFKIELKELSAANSDQVDSYDDGYELFTKLTTRSRIVDGANVNMIDEYYGI